MDRLGEDELRRQVLAGGYRLIEAALDDRPGVTIVTTGAMAPEALDAAAELDNEGVAATVVVLTSPDRAYRSWNSATTSATASARARGEGGHLESLIPDSERQRPIISVHDASSHALAWVGSALGCRQTALGVDRFGESGTISDLHEVTGISAGHIVNAALLACDVTR